MADMNELNSYLDSKLSTLKTNRIQWDEVRNILCEQQRVYVAQINRNIEVSGTVEDK